MSLLKAHIEAILRGAVLDTASAEESLAAILSGETPDVQIAAFLTAIQMRGIGLTELTGFHSVLRRAGTQVDLGENELIDVCGTGGDGKSTFNISTLTAFVLAGAGVKVAKHGNSSATSGSGSSDILAHFGVKFTADENALRQNLRDANICYLHAPLFQPVLKSVAPVRSAIGFRTFFNMLGPLVNPARPRFQFIGVAEPTVLRLYRYLLEDSDTKFALAHSRDGYDEISMTGAFDVVTNEGAETFYPEDIGFASVDPAQLVCEKGVEEAAKVFLQILRNDTAYTAQAEVVVANAAFALRLMQPEIPFADHKSTTRESLRSGAALRSFEILIGQKI